MKEREKKYIALWQVIQRECRRLVFTSALPFLYGYRPTILLYLLHYINGFGTFRKSSGRCSGYGRLIDFPQHRAQTWMPSHRRGVEAYYSNVTDARIAVQGRENLWIFLHPEGIIRRSAKPAAT